MGLLSFITVGNGTLEPELRAALEAEGLVFIEEGLRGSVSYEHFRTQGRSFHRKRTWERMALAISQKRFLIYCRSGAVKLADSEFTSSHLRMATIELEEPDTVSIRVDYDTAGADAPDVSGVVVIRAKSVEAPKIVSELRARVG